VQNNKGVEDDQNTKHPYYDSKSKEDSMKIAVAALGVLAVLFLGTLLYKFLNELLLFFTG
jgi:hypothetical protein